MRNQVQNDYSISLIRLIATSFIVICHIMQYLDIELAWWFNVGVQIFLCMSGFLYGKKNKTENILTFYKKNALKILTDYYVVVIAVILLFIICHPDKIGIGVIPGVLLTSSTLEGGEHLWYISYCLFCYLITPFLSLYFNVHSDKHIVKRFLIVSIFSILLIESFVGYFESTWIFCYILGFFLGKISTFDKGNLHTNVSLIICFIAIIMNSIKILQDYVLPLELDGITFFLYQKFRNFSHVALGSSLFVVFKFIFSKIFKNGYPNVIKKACCYSDKYSYDIYLVHQFLILGPFSLMRLTDTLWLNIIIITALMIVFAVIVNVISKHTRNKISVIINE